MTREEQFTWQAGQTLSDTCPGGETFSNPPPRDSYPNVGGPPERPAHDKFADSKLDAKGMAPEGAANPPIDEFNPEAAYASAEEQIWLPYKQKHHSPGLKT